MAPVIAPSEALAEHVEIGPFRPALAYPTEANVIIGIHTLTGGNDNVAIGLNTMMYAGTVPTTFGRTANITLIVVIGLVGWAAYRGMKQ